jgi:predicted RNA polymerase sigma factor
VAARRKQVDDARQARVRLEAAPHLLAATKEAYELTEEFLVFPDDRLKLLFSSVPIPRLTRPRALR